ncbi:heme exporter protein CcmD [Actinobacillus arthritidis]|uniref:heme exporter protein CcmD n=1 Tax=Actinobacillus arthritidis TaxID=157339 RepID=UPI002442D8B3|nr:heme exporter protein CcmD [Actinobacillus arthritidis]WGE88967.1 heme exporter protein CcmD [Actinobacillus arthritidis]
MTLTFQFNSFAEFLAMDKYGFYVWLSYGISFLAVAGLIWLSRREQKQILQGVKKELAREAQLNKNN